MFSDSTVAYFWSKVQKAEGCWLWTGSRNKDYGQLARPINGVTSAHRLSWMIHFGAIPQGICVCHHCDNPPCVRPDHLFLGTKADNNRDMVEKQRSRAVCGERHPCAKLRIVDVLEMRKLHENEKVGCRKLAKRFGVSLTTVKEIFRRKIWRHI